MTNGESNCQCPHPDESQRVLKRDGVLVVVCVECQGEVGPALELLKSPSETIIVTPDVPELGTGAPCGEDVPNRWGGPL